MIRLLAALSLLLTASCWPLPEDESAAMERTKVALTKLSLAVESVIRDEGAPPSTPSDDLLALATRRDPGLLDPFADYRVLARNVNDHAVVLVCAKQGDRGLLEDAGCSVQADDEGWRTPSRPCAFSSQPVDGCLNR